MVAPNSYNLSIRNETQTMLFISHTHTHTQAIIFDTLRAIVRILYSPTNELTTSLFLFTDCHT